MSDQLTIDGSIDVSKNNPPEFAEKFIPLAVGGTVGTSTRFMCFVADKAYEIVSLEAFPKVIASGTMKVDMLINGASILSTLATATVADTPVAPVFSSTRIAVDDLVAVQTASDSDSVTSITGHLIIRPLLGAERNEF